MTRPSDFIQAGVGSRNNGSATAMRSRMDLLMEMGWRATVPVLAATLVSFGCALGFAVLLL